MTVRGRSAYLMLGLMRTIAYWQWQGHARDESFVTRMAGVLPRNLNQSSRHGCLIQKNASYGDSAGRFYYCAAGHYFETMLVSV